MAEEDAKDLLLRLCMGMEQMAEQMKDMKNEISEVKEQMKEIRSDMGKMEERMMEMMTGGQSTEEETTSVTSEKETESYVESVGESSEESSEKTTETSRDEEGNSTSGEEEESKKEEKAPSTEVNPFPFVGLDHALLEKIITKMDIKSYFRLQQTCRGMSELIQKSKNISVHTTEDIRAGWRQDALYVISDRCQEVDVISLRHLRVFRFAVIGQSIPFDVIYKLFMENNMTVVSLDFCNYQLFTENSEILLKRLKVEHVSARDQILDAILATKSITSVELYCTGSTMGHTIETILNLYERIEIWVGQRETVNNYGLLKELLKKLSTQALPKLDRFRLLYTGETPICIHQIEKILTVCGLSIHSHRRSTDNLRAVDNLIVASMLSGFWTIFRYTDDYLLLEFEYMKEFPRLPPQMCHFCLSSTDDD